MQTIQSSLRVLVFDEADRLVESQHFVELRSILKFLHKGSLKRVPLPPPDAETGKKINKKQQHRKQQQQQAAAIREAEQSKGGGANRRQTFVFSATLTFVHDDAQMPGARGKRKHQRDVVKMDSAQKLSKYGVFGT